MLDEVAWLFNLRGTDIPFNPLFFSYCYVGLDSIKLFMNPKENFKNFLLPVLHLWIIIF